MHAWGMGGTIRTSLNLASYLAQRYEVEILSMVRRRDEPFFDFPAGVTVTAIDDQRSPGVAKRWLARQGSLLMPRADGSRRALSLWTDIELVRAFRRRPTGILIATRPGLNVLAASVAPATLVKIGQEHMHLSAHPPALRRAIARGYPGLDAVVALTPPDADVYRQHIEGPVVTAIPNSVPDLGPHRSDGSARTVIAAGRFRPQKGFDRLIRAFAQVAAARPDWQLLICGRGRKRKRLVQLVEDLDVASNVTIARPVERIGETMAAASIFALSSRFEGFPMVLLEAMSVGLPVVSFDCPTGPREIVENGVNGLLVPDGDIDALAAGILAMIDDEELRRRCSEGAVHTAERYSLTRIGPRWEALIAELTARRPEGSP